MPNISENILVTSPTPIVGKIIDWIMAVIYFLPAIFIILIIGLTSSFIVVKLMIRTFEISALLVVSPVFFACMTADTTRQYFQRFITTFISVVVEILFMAIVYAIGTEWCVQDSTMTVINSRKEFTVWILGAIPNAIMIISMGVMMVKPPRVLKNLIG